MVRLEGDTPPDMTKARLRGCGPDCWLVGLQAPGHPLDVHLHVLLAAGQRKPGVLDDVRPEARHVVRPVRCPGLGPGGYAPGRGRHRLDLV